MKSPDLFRGYQRRTVEFIENVPACAAWVFMGGGKTVSTLTAFSNLREQFEVNRMLVVAPLRVARDVWDAEAREWEHLQHLRVSKALGTEAQRLAALRVPADVHTINRENLPWLQSLFLEEFARNKWRQTRRWLWDVVVLDESQSYKSQSSQRFKAMKRLRKFAPRLVELTGTPAPNRYPDLWSQAYLLDQGRRLGWSEKAYLDRWFTPPPERGMKWELKPHAKEQIHTALGDIVLSLRESDYFDLPEVLPEIRWVTLPDRALRKYREMERKYITTTYSGRVVSAVSAGVCVGKRMQLANGFLYTTEAGESETFHDEKLEALAEVVDAATGPVMLVYNYKSDLRRIEQMLARQFADRVVMRMDTEQSKDLWNAGLIDVLLLHPESAGHGLNLQGAGCELIVWYGLTYNLEHIQQVFARLGGGHRRNGALVVMYILACDTVDEEVVHSTADKALDQEQLIEGIARLADTQREKAR